jgi:flagellar biosynthesis protein FlhF
VPFDRILLTKLDETCGVGGAFDLMEKSGVPLSYFSMGQRVPEDLEVATPERLAALLLADPGRMMQEQVRIGMTA